MLARALRIDEYAAVGILVCLWNWALRYAPDGDITPYPFRDVARAICYTKQPSKLLSSLVEAGFVDMEGDRLYLHDWQEYGGKWYRQVQANKARNRSGALQRFCKDFAPREEEKREEENRVEQRKARSAPVLLFLENSDGRALTPEVERSIDQWCEKVGEELVCTCIRDVAKGGKKPWAYVEKRLDEWARMGFRTQADVESYFAKRRRFEDKARQYSQREYSNNEIMDSMFEKL